MKKRFVTVAVACLAVSLATPAFALKQFSDLFVEVYAGDDASEEFKALVDEAKCNVCHVYRENKKKVRNPYGQTLQELVEEKEFPVDDFKKNPEKYADTVKEFFKEIAKKESGFDEHKTFQARIDADLLPGGDTQGKRDE